MAKTLMVTLTLGVCVLVFAGLALEAADDAGGNPAVTPRIRKAKDIDAKIPTPRFELFVAPAGKPTAKGTKGDPLDLSSVIQNKYKVKPGTVVWLLPGEYVGNFVNAASQKGTEARPIIYRNYDNGRATIIGDKKGYTLEIKGTHCWFWGLEVTTRNSNNKNAFWVLGKHVRLINNYIHHDGICNGNGIGGWDSGPGHVYYGNLISGIAVKEGKKGGHAIYTQNTGTRNGAKVISNNIMFNNYKFTMHVYSTNGTELSGFRIRRNITFGNRRDFEVGGQNKPVVFDCVIEENYFCGPGRNSLMCGWNGRVDSTTIKDNYLVGQIHGGMYLRRLVSGNTVTGNTIISLSPTLFMFGEWKRKSPDFKSNTFDRNTYYWGGPGKHMVYIAPKGNEKLTFKQWREKTGWDANSTVIKAARPAKNKIVMLPNEYDPARTHVLIYNWQKSKTVELDVSSALSAGDKYRLVDVEDYYGKAVLEGTCKAKPLRVPMEGKDYRCFILMKLAK